MEWLRFYKNRFGAECGIVTGEDAKPIKYIFKVNDLEWLRFYNNRFGAGCIMAPGEGAKPNKYM